MDRQWENEKCGTCCFRFTNVCRYNPPVLIQKREHVFGETGSYVKQAVWSYPEVKEDNPACYHWKEK